MSNKKKLGGKVPRLRFPTFNNEPAWEAKQLDKTCEVNPPAKPLPKRFVYIDLESVEAGVLLKKYIINLDGAPSRAQRLLQTGDVLYQLVRPYQKNNYFFCPEDELSYVASTGYAQLRSYQSASFLFHYLHTDAFVDKVMAKASGSNYPAINSGDLSTITIEIPGPKEQQKIADCLSSIDELIAAQNQRLNALKAYKKGLMQQLFPAEGATVPKLRFPEFRDAQEWDITPLSRLGENLDSRRVPITESERVKGEVPYYGASGVIDFVNDSIFDEDLLCISEDGANLVARTYPIAFSITGKSWVNNHAHVIRFKNKSTQIIIENYLNSIKLDDFLTGMAQPKLNRAKLDIIPIPMPDTAEQKRVADCLASIGYLITAQTQKIEALKAHKKGLMQQLFPSADEANG